MTREEIVNSMSLQDAIEVFKDTNTYGTMDIAKTVILKALEVAILSLEKDFTGWISVTDKLPDELSQDDEVTEWVSRDAVRTGKQLKLFSELFLKKIKDAPTIIEADKEG